MASATVIHGTHVKLHMNFKKKSIYNQYLESGKIDTQTDRTAQVRSQARLKRKPKTVPKEHVPLRPLTQLSGREGLCVENSGQPQWTRKAGRSGHLAALNYIRAEGSILAGSAVKWDSGTCRAALPLSIIGTILCPVPQ